MPLDMNTMVTAYLNRLGLSRSDVQASQGLAALTKLTRAQLDVIPFENVEPLTGTIPSIDPESLCKKLLVDGRGGYCFELNGLLYLMLRELGFKVQRTVTYIMINRPNDSPGPRAHMIMFVTVDEGEFIADVGMGGFCVRDPIRFVPDVEQKDEGTGDIHRILSSPIVGHIVQRKMPASEDAVVPSSRPQVAPADSAWFNLYAFLDNKPALQADFDMGNQHTSSYARSPFLVGPMAGRVSAERRITLFHRMLVVQSHGAPPAVRMMESAEEVVKFCENEVGVVMPSSDVRAAFLKRVHETWDNKDEELSRAG